MTDEGHPYRVGCECADCDLVTADRAGEALADALFSVFAMQATRCECGGRTWRRVAGGVVCAACHRMREDS